MWLFLRLYFLIVVTMLVVGWSIEQAWRHFGDKPVEDSALKDFTELVVASLDLENTAKQNIQLDHFATDNISLELIDQADLAGAFAMSELDNNKVVSLQEDSRTWWLLAQLNTSDQILSIRYQYASPQRSALEWLLLFLFYAAIALAVMLWVWPLSRDMQRLKQATLGFGQRNWSFNVHLSQRSQVRELSQAFNTMAQRINSLVQSHKDMSNAVSHEIKTPLARMKFAIELIEHELQHVGDKNVDDKGEEIPKHLNAISDDIDKLNALISATMKYAILDSADFSLNLDQHDFTSLLPALAEGMKIPAHIEVKLNINPAAKRVCCDGYLMETLINNLLANAIRFAKAKVAVEFVRCDDQYVLTVDDDGPGIPIQDQQRVFHSFVQLSNSNGAGGDFGLGLAIVKKIAEWHQGSVKIVSSSLGGTCFEVCWPCELE